MRPTRDIIVPPLTWISDIASVIQCGFNPVFADMDLDTLGMNTKEILNKITNKTVAVFLSHIQGFNALTEELLNVLKNKNIKLIEDVCDPRCNFKNKKVGTFSYI